MGEFDSATWSAVGAALTVVGLAISVVAWRRRGAASGLRGVAWSLLPLAAALTGLLRVVWEVTDAVASWAVRLVFSPVVWAGIVVAGVSATLFVVSGFLRRRTPRGPSRKERRAAGAQPGSSPAAVTAKGPAAAGTGSPGRSAPDDDDDMADIEAILKKHGIS